MAVQVSELVTAKIRRRSLLSPLIFVLTILLILACLSSLPWSIILAAVGIHIILCYRDLVAYFSLRDVASTDMVNTGSRQGQGSGY